MNVVYAIHCDRDPSNSVYVGKTIRPNKRFLDHIHEALNGTGQSLKLSWLRKWLPSLDTEIHFSILESDISDNEIDEAESFYISYFKSIGMNLLNMTEGGDGFTSSSAKEFHNRPEIKKKKSESIKAALASRGKKTRPPVRESTREKLRQNALHQWQDPARKASVSKAVSESRKTESEETKARRSASLSKVLGSPEVRARISAGVRAANARRKAGQ